MALSTRAARYTTHEDFNPRHLTRRQKLIRVFHYKSWAVPSPKSYTTSTMHLCESPNTPPCPVPRVSRRSLPRNNSSDRVVGDTLPKQLDSHARQEADGRRLVRVVLGKLQEELERSSLPRCVIRSENHRLHVPDTRS